MALGRQKKIRQLSWIAPDDLPKAPGHPFYKKLNRVLAKAGFDEWVEDLCAPYYADRVGRPGIPPGVYFRMLLVGYFEGIGSQRGIAWRCADSLSLRGFLALDLTEKSPDHSSLTRIRQRLPMDVHEAVFVKVLEIAHHYKLIKGSRVLIDSTTLEANAAMKSIVRKDTGEDWRAYLRRLAQEDGIENATDEDLRRMDRKRKGKKVSNEEWESSTDPDSRIAKMKDGRTHMAYKAEHAVDADTGVILSAQIHTADTGDTDSAVDALWDTQTNVWRSGSEALVKEAALDKGYHSLEVLAEFDSLGVRAYIPERKQHGKRRWTDKPAEQKRAFFNNRRRCKGAYGRSLQRLRSEIPERSFAHMCETGGGRRSWLRGCEDVQKRYWIQAAAHNLGVVMRELFGVGTPRSLQGSAQRALALVLALVLALWRPLRRLLGIRRQSCSHAQYRPIRSPGGRWRGLTPRAALGLAA